MADQPRSSAAAAMIIYLLLPFAAAGLLLNTRTTPGGRLQSSPNPTADKLFRDILLLGESVARVAERDTYS